MAYMLRIREERSNAEGERGRHERLQRERKREREGRNYFANNLLTCNFVDLKPKDQASLSLSFAATLCTLLHTPLSPYHVVR